MEQNEMITKEDLEHMANVDIRDVDNEDLVDIDNVYVDPDLPREERIVDYIRQIKNPYCYKWHGVTIKLSFSGNRTLEDCLLDCLSVE